MEEPGTLLRKKLRSPQASPYILRPFKINPAVYVQLRTRSAGDNKAGRYSSLGSSVLFFERSFSLLTLSENTLKE